MQQQQQQHDDDQLVDSALKDIELAIKGLQQLSLVDSRATGSSSSKQNSSCTCSIEKKDAFTEIWADLLVKELMNAQSMESAKARAMEVVQGFYNEITAKEKAKAEERLMQENWILKRAVVIQHQLRQKEKQDSKELLKALQLKNYALTLHFKQIQTLPLLPGLTFHPPDVF
ncbi:hypothetical protein AB3S75_027776 [Citrus x aurantiifolia]